MQGGFPNGHCSELFPDPNPNPKLNRKQGSVHVRNNVCSENRPDPDQASVIKSRHTANNPCSIAALNQSHLGKDQEWATKAIAPELRFSGEWEVDQSVAL